MIKINHRLPFLSAGALLDLFIIIDDDELNKKLTIRVFSPFYAQFMGRRRRTRRDKGHGYARFYI
ncbi:hypothetical protein DMQ95_24095 [Klebsiella pneumoniae]|nr:hypothetical protein DMQ95_24095 [Klebsiella pneumoniae]ROF82563.1 hypothetical protein C4Y69_007355 [Klebsiella pneumoniae subsp. pneumoniae]ROH19772.1 hypothetical protein BL144_00015590 [Klebsiella pneumoniae]HBY0307637.1 hypothetical protein [Klebsiella pneumoniae subsp. pneumoniae]